MFFFTDGYFDFDEKAWRSSGELIEPSKWFVPKESSQNHHRTFPTMNDRIAYIKDEFSFKLDSCKKILFNTVVVYFKR